jgi:hypothetical protein
MCGFDGVLKHDKGGHGFFTSRHAIQWFNASCEPVYTCDAFATTGLALCARTPMPESSLAVLVLPSLKRAFSHISQANLKCPS